MGKIIKFSAVLLLLLTFIACGGGSGSPYDDYDTPDSDQKPSDPDEAKPDSDSDEDNGGSGDNDTDDPGQDDSDEPEPDAESDGDSELPGPDGDSEVPEPDSDSTIPEVDGDSEIPAIDDDPAHPDNDTHPVPAVCGDGVVNLDEVCDGGTTTCEELGLGQGTVSFGCKSDCSGWENTGLCVKPDEACLGLPEHARWTGTGTVNQTWDGAAWQPPNTAYHNEDGSDYPCGFECELTYEWDYGGWRCKPSVTLLCTGQLDCYNETERMPMCPSESQSFFGQDANYIVESLCILPGAAQGENPYLSIIEDSVTGLQWYEYMPIDWNSYTYVRNLCDNLVYGEKDDWRMPTIYELHTIFNYGKHDPAVTKSVFKNISSNKLWSKTSHPTIEKTLWVVDTEFGYTTYQKRDHNSGDPEGVGLGGLLCVRGGEYNFAAGAIELLNDGTMFDTKNHRMWHSAASEELKTWTEALSYCETSRLGGHDNWRLPNVTELMSLIDYNAAPDNFLADLGGDSTSPKEKFWTSTTFEADPKNAWYVGFDDGQTKETAKSTSLRVRCVR